MSTVISVPGDYCADSLHSLITRLVNNPHDAEAWNEFFERFDPFIHHLTAAAFRKYLGSCSDSEAGDFAQQLYERLMRDNGRALRNFRGQTEQDFQAYLARIGYHLIQDHRRAIVGTVSLEDKAAFPEDSPYARDLGLVCEPDQERALARRELRDLIKSHLAEEVPGPENGRDSLVFMLRYDGYSAKEVADALHLTPNHVNVIYQRTRKKLVAALNSRSDKNSILHVLL